MEKKQQFNLTKNMKIIKFIKEEKYILIYIIIIFVINLILLFTFFKETLAIDNCKCSSYFNFNKYHCISIYHKLNCKKD
jgi:hypothetical protein